MTPRIQRWKAEVQWKYFMPDLFGNKQQSITVFVAVITRNTVIAIVIFRRNYPFVKIFLYGRSGLKYFKFIPL